MYVVLATRKIFLTLLALIAFITLAFLYMGHFQSTLMLDTLAREERDIATIVYEKNLGQIRERYERIATQLLNDPDIINALETLDRPGLQQQVSPLYDRLRAEDPGLSTLHFITPDQHSFLRLHRPDRYGDDLEPIRPVIGEVSRLKRYRAAMEIGRYGIYYRIAFPVIGRASQVIGVIEFGIDINSILSRFSEEYHSRSMLLVKKRFFDIMHETNPELAYRAIGKGYYLLAPEQRLLCNCDGSIIDHPYLINTQDGKNDLVFRMTDLGIFKGESIGAILFVKDLGFYFEKVAYVRNGMLATAAILLLFTVYFLRKIFTQHSRMIRRYQSILEQKNHTLERLTQTDHLTKAYNRRHCDALLRKELKQVGRHGIPLAVLLFDVDNFKKINDAFGHNAGDRVLQEIAQLTAASIRENDHFGRWGGEEFIIIAPQTSLEQATLLAEKLRMMIDENRFASVEHVSCSFGVAACTDNPDAETLIHHADLALYEAKESGKNRVVSFGRPFRIGASEHQPQYT